MVDKLQSIYLPRYLPTHLKSCTCPRITFRMLLRWTRKTGTEINKPEENSGVEKLMA